MRGKAVITGFAHDLLFKCKVSRNARVDLAKRHHNRRLGGVLRHPGIQVIDQLDKLTMLMSDLPLRSTNAPYDKIMGLLFEQPLDLAR